jgi:hypothetical protein
MNRQQFDELLDRREEARITHELECAVLTEEPWNRMQHEHCLRLYDEIEQLQALIDAEIAAERASA